MMHGLARLGNPQQNCWPMILIGRVSETYRGGMGAVQEERQEVIASPFLDLVNAKAAGANTMIRDADEKKAAPGWRGLIRGGIRSSASQQNRCSLLAEPPRDHDAGAEICCCVG